MAKFEDLKRKDGQSFIKTRRVVKDGKATYEQVMDKESGEPVMTDQVAYYEAPVKGELRTTAVFGALFDERSQALAEIRDATKSVRTAFKAPFSKDDYKTNPAAAKAIAGALTAYAELVAQYPELAEVPMDLVREGEGKEAHGGLSDFQKGVSHALSDVLGGTPGTKISDLKPDSVQSHMSKHQRDVKNIKASTPNQTLQRQMIAKLNGDTPIAIQGRGGRTYKSEPLPEGAKSWNDYYKENIQKPRDAVKVMDNFASEAWNAVGKDGAAMNALCSKIDMAPFGEAVDALKAAREHYATVDAEITAKGTQVIEDRLKGDTYVTLSTKLDAPATDREVEAPEEEKEDQQEAEF